MRRPGTLRATALAITAALAAASCVMDAPIVHRADERASYASKYFRVDAPAGPGWEVVVRTAELPWAEEPQLFTPWVAPRIGFILHDWDELWPHGLPPEPTIELAALPATATPEPAPPLGAERTGEREIAGLRWIVFERTLAPELRIVDLLARSEGVEHSAHLRARGGARGSIPPELARVLAGLHPEAVAVSEPAVTIERGVTALHRLAIGGEWDPHWVEEARAGAEALARNQPERSEGPLFLAGLALLVAEHERLGAGGTASPTGPFEVAREAPDGRISTAALDAPYDAAQAERWLREAVAREPTAFWARYHLGAALARGGNPRAGARELEVLTAQHPDSAVAWFALALMQRDAGDLAAARGAAARARAANRKREVFASYGTGFVGKTLIDRLEQTLGP